MWVLGQDLADQPHMTEGVEHRSLEHALDRFWSSDVVRVFLDGAVLNRAGGQSPSVDRDGVVDKELDSDGGEPHGGWASRAVRGRFVGEKKLGATNRKSGDDVSSGHMPEELRTECGLVEGDRSVSIVDGQHRRDLSSHRRHRLTSVEEQNAR